MIPADDDNPFRDMPAASLSPFGERTAQGLSVPPPVPRSMVNHVPTVAILMMVQGGLEALMGLLLIAMGLVMPLLLEAMTAQRGRPPGGFPADTEPWIVTVTYGLFGVVVLVGAGLHIVAGVRNYAFRSRILGIVALIAGIAASIFTCCAPTGIALGIYGLICYTNPPVIQAFAAKVAGTKREGPEFEARSAKCPSPKE